MNRPSINSDADMARRFDPAPWLVAALLAGAIVGLVHDANYATARGLQSAEEGRNMEGKAVMEEGLQVAAGQRVAGLVLLIAACGACLLTTPRLAPLRFDALAATAALGLCWALASVAWSVDRDTTARELVRLLLYLATAAALALRFDARQVCLVIAASLGGSVLAAVAFEAATGGFRPWTANYRLTGSMHSNVLAAQAATVGIIAYAFAWRRDARAALWWTIVIATLAVVVLTKARTALVTFAAGAVAAHIVGRPMRDWLLFASFAGTVLAFALLVAATFGLFQEQKLARLANMGRTDDTAALTGRVPLWNYIWSQTDGRRARGAGWGAFWRVDQVLDAHRALGWYPRHAHNAYFQVFVDLGAIGLAIVVAIAAQSLGRAARLIRQTRRPEFTALAALIAAISVNGVAEAAFAMPRDLALVSAAIAFTLMAVPSSPVTMRCIAAHPPRRAVAAGGLCPVSVEASSR